MIAAKPGYRPELDGLRTVALLAVILHHFGRPLLPGGYLGVDIFFVISGFVITSSLSSRTPPRNLGDLLLGFYSRRLQRLLPALLVCVLVTGLLACLFDPLAGQSLRTGIAAVLGYSNIQLNGLSSDYFARPAEQNAFTQTWSLGVEEQFYLIFPVLLWTCGFARGQQDGARRLGWVVGAVSVASLLAFLALTLQQRTEGFYLMPARFWELGAGCLLFLGLGADRLGKGPLPLPGLLPLGLLLGCLALPVSAQPVATPLAVGATGLLMAAMLRSSRDRVTLLLSHPLAVRIGLMSYSLYLWHWSVLTLSRWTIGIQWWTVPIQIILMGVLATASYRFVEVPMRRANWPGRRGRTIIIAVLAALAAAGLLWSTDRWFQAPLFLGNKDGRVREPWSALAIAGTNLSPANCELNNTDNPAPASAEEFAALLNLCTARPPARPEGAAPPRLFLIGDSHAMAFSPVLTRALNDGGQAVSLLARTGCSFPATRHGNSDPSCTDFLQRAETAILEAARPGDGVVISNYLLSHLGDAGDLSDTRDQLLDARQQPLTAGEAKERAYLEGLQRFSSQASARGVTVVLIGATPRHLESDNCVPDWFNLQPKERCEQGVAAEQAHSLALNQRLQKALPAGVRFLDPVAVLCPEGCDNAEMLSLLRDNDHLSQAGARRLGPRLLEILEAERGEASGTDQDLSVRNQLDQG